MTERRIMEGRVVRATGAAPAQPKIRRDLIEPTPEEARNGWDAESLVRYQAERKQAQSAIIFHDPDARPPKRPSVANGRYSPFRWRR